MKINRYFLLICFIAFLGLSDGENLFAKGDNEVGTGFSYFDRKSVVDSEPVKTTEFSLDVLYLRSFKSLWSGGEFSYWSSRSTLVDQSYMILGVPFKYWVKGPESKGIGVYLVGTPYLGTENSTTGSGTMLGLNMGPGIVVFLNDMVGIDTKIYFDYRRIGSSPSTTTGLKIGFSIYF